jgi:predicted HicB family RNase H-like nuclease
VRAAIKRQLSPYTGFDSYVAKVYGGSMEQGKTVELRIRGVPAEVHRSLKLEAVRRGIRLNDLVIEVFDRHTKEVAKGKPSK